MTDHERTLWKKARRAALLLQLAPFARFVAVTGSLGRGETKPDSDADLFIVTAPGRLYTARAFALGLLQLTGQRVNIEAGRIGGAVDPNYWLTIDNLDLAPHNAYVARDYTYLVPLWDSSDIYGRLIQTNRWVETYQRRFRVVRLRKPFFIFRGLQAFLEVIVGDRLERWARSVQEQKVRSFAERQGKSDKVVLSDDELRLHL